MKKLLLLFISTSYLTLHAIAPLNLLRPSDHTFMMFNRNNKKFYSVFIGSWGMSGMSGWNSASDKVSAIHFLDADQNSLAMVKGFAQGTELSNIAQTCNAVTGDDGIRGHFNITGDFQVPFTALLGARWYFNDNWSLNVHLPIYHTKLNNLSWYDQTKNITADDACVHTNITDNLKTNVARLGGNLSLNDWSETGAGDLTALLAWDTTFKQYKPWIKGVNIGLKAGFSFPTGVKKDEDKVMHMPFGNDGSVGTLIGGGLAINYIHKFTVGVDGEFTHIFNNTRNRRIKVDNNQTEFLLLAKTDVQKRFGVVQRYNLYAQGHFFERCTVRLGYQHVKLGDDTLFVISNSYSSTIANTAESIKGWTTHNALFQLKWNTDDSTKLLSEFSVMYCHPFNGTRSVQSKQLTIGCVLRF